ncbi:uncharacterized protein LOC130895408 isoform X1 [Diorhabda carinulata]|uniref:uncharacterized protein LOC130895408 isoform X1 n=1 Tax=Diorhabda carinulata TaxID=1163345 RepID=UPI0025A10F62|nr:uncharacterized protein LOC130895408 isoform X1 [Diorhabda carinulata]XP_057658642.1 uncharacterized protein LOC130895408 isoform X1 [Diorhabda carinulata]XP_057658643.1 uncharacterized protein LOC130895408 isoform X1 [Diorhabda carinulata]
MATRKKKSVVSQRQLYRRVAEANLAPVSQNCYNTSLIVNNDSNESSNSVFFADSMCESENDTCSSRDLDFNVNSPNENLLFNDATLYNHLTSYSSNVPPNDLFPNEPPPSDLHSKLSNWAASRYVRRTVVTHLLHILHPYHNELPLDSRTLLKTPRETKTKSLLNGEYCHFGLVNALKLKLLSVPNISQYSIINISFNVDGLPIYRNGQKHDLWPILALVKNFKSEPFVVGSFLGSGKPNLLSAFLEDFLIELSNLLTTGIEINNNIHEVKFHSFVCDAPARAYLKCVKTHSGYSSCEGATTLENTWDVSFSKIYLLTRETTNLFGLKLMYLIIMENLL